MGVAIAASPLFGLLLAALSADLADMPFDTVGNRRCIRTTPTALVYTSLPIMAFATNATGRGPSADGRASKIRSSADIGPSRVHRLLRAAARAASI